MLVVVVMVGLSRVEGNERRWGEGGIQRKYLGGHHFRVAA